MINIIYKLTKFMLKIDKPDKQKATILQKDEKKRNHLLNQSIYKKKVIYYKYS